MADVPGAGPEGWQADAGRSSRYAIGVVVQLVRIPACHAGGRGFESRPLRQLYRGERMFAFFLARVPVFAGRRSQIGETTCSISFINTRR